MDVGVVAQESSSVLDRLALRVATFDESEVTDSVGAASSTAAMADTLGVGLAGAATDPVRILAAVAGRQGDLADSLLLGTAERVNALDAGMLNGVAAHALDFDDGNSLMAGHPSTMLVPAVLALGEELGCPAEQGRGGLCCRLRGHRAPVVRRQHAPLREGLAPDLDDRRVRGGGGGRPPARP